MRRNRIGYGLKVKVVEVVAVFAAAVGGHRADRVGGSGS